MATHEVLAGDLLDGVPAIAAYLGTPLRRTYYLCETGQIPAFKMSPKADKWQARKSTLNCHFAALEQAAVA